MQDPIFERDKVKVADIELATGRSEEAFDQPLGTVKRTCGDERNKARLRLPLRDLPAGRPQ